MSCLKYIYSAIELQFLSSQLRSIRLDALSISKLVALSMFIVITKYCSALVFNTKPHKWPVLENDGEHDLCKVLQAGTEKRPDGIFEIPTQYKRTVIVPRRSIDELKALPDDKLSFRLDVIERLVGRQTMIGTHEKSMIDSVKFNLTKNIGSLQSHLQDEAAYAVAKHVGDCEDWKCVSVFQQMLHIIALMSGRIFVGPSLNRNPEWLSCMIHYTEDAFAGATKLWAYPVFLHPLVARFLPELRRVNTYIATAQRLIKPVLKQRINELSNSEFKPPHYMIQFLIENAGSKAQSPSFQAKHQILAQFTAMHTTAMNACHAIYDLAAFPEHIAPLREELETVLAEEGGVLNKNALSKLRKLNSFFRETQRLNRANLLGMGRKVTADLTLSDGTFLPKGTFIAVDTHSINHDPYLWQQPDRFDGFRFEKLRAAAGNGTKFQAVTTGPDSLAFGHGVHACPGRFFAVNETKVLLAELILNYDWRYRPGQSRPANIFIDTMIAPDPTIEMEFRRRQRI